MLGQRLRRWPNIKLELGRIVALVMFYGPPPWSGHRFWAGHIHSPWLLAALDVP